MPEQMVLTIGIVIIAVILLGVYATKILPAADLTRELEAATFLEKSKSIIYTLSAAEQGEVLVKLGAPLDLKIEKSDKGSSITVGERTGTIFSEVASVDIESDRIRFVKNKGEPVSIIG